VRVIAMFSGMPPYHLMWSNVFDPNRPQVKKPAQWRRIGKLCAPYWKQEALVLTAVALVSSLGLLPPLCTMWLIDKAIPSHDFLAVCLCVGGMVASAFLGALVGVYQGYLNSYVGEGIMRDIRDSLIAHIHKMPLDFFASTKTGEILNRVSNDVDAIDNVVTHTMISVVTSIFMIITTLVAIFLLDWRLSLISLVVIPLMVLPFWPIGRKMYLLRKQTREKSDELHSLMQETLSISGITLMKSFVRENHEGIRFRKAGNEFMNLAIKLGMVGRWFMMFITAMVTIGPATIWLVGGWLAIDNQITVGALVSFIALIARLYTPVSGLAGVQIQLISALAVFERIFDYLDMKEEAPDSPAAVELGTITGAVQFDGVEFNYPNGRLALDGVSFKVKPGQMAAFVGESGAGKTTITNLVPRFYDPQAGRVLIDDLDVRDVKLNSLRQHIGMVMQETYLFHDTIANNLRYGRTDASQEEIEEAARAASIHDFIAALPEGYETIVGERGHKLSGGERQRIAIARVLLKDPKVLILDEATSSLDSHNEALIQEALVPLLSGRTSLVVAHRLSTILSADVIFVVDNGKVVEHGTHAELLRKGTIYASLYNRQFRESASKPPNKYRNPQ
jgi:ATP-binding cassette subfamily B protein